MFSIFGVPDEAAETSEQMGTKFKFWYQDEALGRILFKEGRPGTGENWSEKLCESLAQLLGIPHARYEFGEWQGRQGIITPNFVPKGSLLIHGNELVGAKVTVDNENEQLRYYAERTHTASRVFQYLKQREESLNTPQHFVHFDGVKSALAVFIGYVLFDTWVSNQDRHSENWGVIRSQSDLALAPSYDHGSALGRTESDERRQLMMVTKDRGASIDAYVARARSAMYPPGAKPKAYLSLDLFEYAYKMDPVAGRAWLDKLASVTSEQVQAAIAEIPPQLMSDTAREFTARLLQINKNRLLSLLLK